ncbi:MAG TPA: hypothetical protein VH438_07870 [Gemmatimonadales bacterium]
MQEQRARDSQWLPEPAPRVRPDARAQSARRPEQVALTAARGASAVPRALPQAAWPGAASALRRGVLAHRAETAEEQWAEVPAAQRAVPQLAARLEARLEVSPGPQAEREWAVAEGPESVVPGVVLAAPRRGEPRAAAQGVQAEMVQAEMVQAQVVEATPQSALAPERREPVPQQARPVSPLEAAQPETRPPETQPAPRHPLR